MALTPNQHRDGLPEPVSNPVSARDPKEVREQIWDEFLVLRSQSGEVKAMAELLRRWQPRLLRRACLLVGVADGADALQEALIAAARSIRSLDDPALFGPWARRIVANKCADLVRRRRREAAASARSTRPSFDAGGGAVAAVSEADELAAMRLALDRLPLERRALLVMRYARDMTVAQIAYALGVPEGTVKSRLHHARDELRTTLERNP